MYLFFHESVFPFSLKATKIERLFGILVIFIQSLIKIRFQGCVYPDHIGVPFADVLELATTKEGCALVPRENSLAWCPDAHPFNERLLPFRILVDIKILAFPFRNKG